MLSDTINDINSSIAKHMASGAHTVVHQLGHGYYTRPGRPTHSPHLQQANALWLQQTNRTHMHTATHTRRWQVHFRPNTYTHIHTPHTHTHTPTHTCWQTHCRPSRRPNAHTHTRLHRGTQTQTPGLAKCSKESAHIRTTAHQSIRV